MGAMVYSKSNLEKVRAKGEKIKLTVMGILHLQNDIPPKLALQVIESVKVRGIFNAGDPLKAALADRMNQGQFRSSQFMMGQAIPC